MRHDMIPLELVKVVVMDKANDVSLVEFFLSILAIALQGHSVSILCLFPIVGCFWSNRQRVPKGSRPLPGPWGNPS
jgi:hypothetical protein